MEKFTKEKDELLIESVKSNSILYDTRDKNFKNNNLKHKVWENISETLNIAIADCKKRWRSLRDQFAKKKKNDSSTGQARNSKNNWEYMTQLSFLSNTPSQRSTLTNVVGESTQETLSPEFSENNTLGSGEATNDVEGVESDITPQANESDISRHANESDISRHANESDIARHANESDIARRDKERDVARRDKERDVARRDKESDVASHARKKKKVNSETALMDFLTKRDENRNQIYEKLINTPEENPTKKFFDSMGELVSKFPPDLIAETRLKVCQVVTEMELKMHQRASMTPMPFGGDHSEDYWFLPM